MSGAQEEHGPVHVYALDMASATRNLNAGLSLQALEAGAGDLSGACLSYIGSVESFQAPPSRCV